MSMDKKLLTIAGAILFLFSCSNGTKNDLRDLLDAEGGNFITSEKLNYKIDTIASGLNSAWGLTFLPNRDLLVTEKKVK